MPVECDVRVGEVVDDEELVLLRQRDRALEEVDLDARRRRIVRVGEHDDTGTTRPYGLLDRLDPALDRGAHDLGPREERRGAVDRVARRRHDGGVARLDEHPHQVGEAVLGADRRDGLRLGVELDAETTPVEVADRRPQLRDAATR